MVRWTHLHVITQPNIFTEFSSMVTNSPKAYKSSSQTSEIKSPKKLFQSEILVTQCCFYEPLTPTGEFARSLAVVTRHDAKRVDEASVSGRKAPYKYLKQTTTNKLCFFIFLSLLD